VTAAAVSPPREALPLRQRQRLIDASITALHLYGPTGTTVARVTGIAKMSPGIVRFYFRSKGAMLVESLQFLATEFEERVMTPVAALRDQPALALRRLVELYLDPEIASPRKISVWYAFWGEATARQEYLAICGQKDASFATLVHDLIQRMIVASGRRHLDSDAIALGLIGVLEIMWQNFAFEEEADIDRAQARQRCMAYLSSIFPREFAALNDVITSGVASTRDPQAAADDERDRIFRGAWQFAGHELDIPDRGDFATLDLVALRALIVRDSLGTVRAFRNACRGVPHALVTDRRGHCGDGRICCDVHGLAYGLDGRAIPPREGAGLLELDVHRAQGLMFVRSPATSAARRWPEPEQNRLDDASSLQPGEEFRCSVAADWKTVMRTLLAAGQRQFVAPNLLIEKSAEALAIMQVIPTAAGRSTVHRFVYARDSRPSKKFGTDALAQLQRELTLAESTQQGEADPDYRPDASVTPSPAVAAFEHMLLDAD
jgi:TetR/AcrR family transcriptional repressor of bet genes